MLQLNMAWIVDEVQTQQQSVTDLSSPMTLKVCVFMWFLTRVLTDSRAAHARGQASCLDSPSQPSVDAHTCSRAKLSFHHAAQFIGGLPQA